MAGGGGFLSLTIDGATTLFNKMVSNQSWGEERKSQKCMHTVKEMNMLESEIDLLMKKLEDRAQDKEAMKGTVQALESHMTCEVYGNVGHLGNDCTKTHEEAAFINNGFANHKVIKGGTISPSRKVIRTSILITIRINLLLRTWFLAKLELLKISLKS